MIGGRQASGLPPCRQRLAILVASLSWLGWSAVAAAHDFWLQPDRFWLEPQAPTSITLMVGHGASRQRSPILLDRIVRFSALGPRGGPIDLRAALHLGGEASDGAIQFREAGAYVLALETDNRAQSHLPALHFNEYLIAEGLRPALRQRALAGRADADGSESYRRIAKAIVIVGGPDFRAEASVTARLGLPLEIVFERNPFAPGDGASLSVRVYYRGRPLAGALVKLNDLDHDATPVEIHLTDEEGRASFAAPADGTWQFNVIWTRPLPASRETDFDTMFSSLTFGYPAR